MAHRSLSGRPPPYRPCILARWHGWTYLHLEHHVELLSLAALELDQEVSVQCSAVPTFRGSAATTITSSLVRSRPPMASAGSRSPSRPGLTAQTVSVIVRRLIEQGIVQESGSSPSAGGKPRTTLRINPTAAYAVGIHFDPIEVSVVVVDMMGHELAHSRHAISPRLEPEALIAEAAEVAHKHLAELEITG